MNETGWTRVWTNTEGRTAIADFIGVDGDKIIVEAITGTAQQTSSKQTVGVLTQIRP